MHIKTNNKQNIFYLLLVMIFIVSSCSLKGYKGVDGRYYANKNRYLSKDDLGNIKYKGHYKIGRKYKIKGKTYKPKAVKRYSKKGEASWYGKRYGFHGNTTANGDIFNKNLLTAAHKTLPMPCLVKVTNLKNGKSLIVMVNDRGPFAYNREIDLSEKSATLLDIKKRGKEKVKVQFLRSETAKLLNYLGLKEKSGCRAKRCVSDKECTVNCYIKRVNLKHGLKHNF